MSEKRELIRKHIDALSEHGWLAGESFSDYKSERFRTNTYSSQSTGVDPFRKMGVIQAGFANNAVTVPGVPNQVIAMKPYRPVPHSMYGIDDHNNVLFFDTSADRASVIQSLNATTVTNLSRALEYHRDSLYVAHNLNATVARLAKYSPLSSFPAWNLSYNMSLVATALSTGTPLSQVLLSWQGRLYVMAANQVNYILGTEASPVVLTQGVTLAENRIIKTACGYGTYVAIGCSDSYQLEKTNQGNCWVYIYDGVSLTATKEIPFFDVDITNLAYDGHDLFAFGPSGKWVYDGTGFVRLTDLDATVPQNGADVMGGFLWFQGNNVVRAYGRPNQLVDKAWTRPHSVGGTQNVLRWVNAQKLYSASSDGNVYVSSNTTWNTSALFQTRWINAGNGQQFYVRAVKIGYEPLASGDSFNVNLQDENSSAAIIATISYASDAANNPTSKLITENEFSIANGPYERIQLQVNFTGGKPKIAYVDLLLETMKEV